MKGDLPAGARRALMAMTGEWQFAGKATFNSSSARSLVKRGFADEECLSDFDDRHKFALRLTPAGLLLQQIEREKRHDQA